MKRKVFSITMCVALLVLLIPAFAGTVLAEEEQGGPGVVTEVPTVVGLAITPTEIDFGVVLPEESSGVDPGARTINLNNIGNCDQLITTEIVGEERVVEGETLGHGDGSQTVFGPTDYTPLIEDSKHVYLDGLMVTANLYDLDEVNGLVTFDDPPAGGALVTIDYQSMSTFYSGSGNPTGPLFGGPAGDAYGMTLNDPGCPPEKLAADWSRVLVDDNDCDPVAQIYVEPDYPVGIEGAQIVFWAEAQVGDNPPVVEITVPTEGQDIDITEVITVTAHITDDWGVLGAGYMIDNPLDPPTPMALVSGNANDGIYEAAWDTAAMSEGAHTVYVGCMDTSMQTGIAAVSVNLHVIIPPPVVTLITTDPVSPVDNLVRITATATGTDIVAGVYSIDDPLFGSPVIMTPDVALPADAVTFTADWDCTTVGNGPHTIWVAAQDILGQPGVNFLAIEVDNPPPTPALGAEWVYLVTYAEGDLTYEDITEWTVTVTGEEMVGAVDCYTTSTAFSVPPERMVDTIDIVIVGADGWNSKLTVDPLKTVASVLMFGNPLSTYIDWTYTGDHGWTLSVGKAWDGLQDVVLVPPLAPASQKLYQIEVTAEEAITVPAGTFDCYKVEYTLVEVDGAPVTPVLEKIEYFSPDVCGNVKIDNLLGFNFPEIQELLSYTPGP